MRAALIAAPLVALANVALARMSLRRAARLDRWNAVLQAAAFALRFLILFGTAHALWRARGRPGEVVVFILLAAVLQTVGQAWIAVKR